MTLPPTPAPEAASADPIVAVSGVTHQWDGKRFALRDVSFDTRRGEIFGLLGPNGSGKSTLFAILSTLMPRQQGEVRLFGLDPDKNQQEVRRRLGVVFQNPSLDGKLRVGENLRCHGQIHGLGGKDLSTRIDASLERFGLRDRVRDQVDILSGGLRRRVELAKSLLTRPELLILDEPSAGLDPSATLDLWHYLELLRDDSGLTILVSTHHMDEAERCTRLAILAEGKLVALDTPRALKEQVGGEVVTFHTRQPKPLAERLTAEIGGDGLMVVTGAVRLRRDAAATLVPDLLQRHRDQVEEVTIGRPSLRDVYLERTGSEWIVL